MNIKQEIYLILTSTRESKYPITSKFINSLLIFLILLSSIIVIVESMNLNFHSYLQPVYSLLFIIFLIEYIARVLSITVSEQYEHSIWGRLRYIISPMSIIDLIALLSFGADVFGQELVAFGALRSLRILAILRFSRYSKSLNKLFKVINSCRADLISSLIIIFVLLLCTSSLVYHAEHAAQPEQFPDIPTAMWWAVVTLTTVGYGDIYPITALGKFIGSISVLLGIAVFAIPTSILTSKFMEEKTEEKSSHQREKLVT